MAEEKEAVELLEEDDEFEEFQADEWEEAKDDEQLWQDDWDDDDTTDDFMQQLRAQIDQHKEQEGRAAGGSA